MIHQIKVKKQHINFKQLWRVKKDPQKKQDADIQHYTQMKIGKIHLPQSTQITNNQLFIKQLHQPFNAQQTEKDSI